MTNWIGCSGFSYKAWSPSFYPTGLKEAGFLPYYAARLCTVELNSSFYRLPSAKSVAGWVSAVPPGFRFAVKAPQRITHQLRLKGTEEAAAEFAAVLHGFGETLGPVLFQLPPNLKLDQDRLASFLRAWPRSFKAAFEFRHESWLEASVFALLKEHNVALVTADGEAMNTPLLSCADFSYTRLRAEAYTAAQLSDWAQRLAALGATDSYVYFKHEVTAPQYALQWSAL